MIIKYKEMINIAYENINLWFAKDKKNKIITVDEVTEENKSTYYCPLCNSEVIPKAIKKNAKMTSHFAHIDRSKCDSEHMIHWWFKHKFLTKGDKFIVKTDKETKYECKEILVEQSYLVGDKSYQPDVAIITTTGETVYFEMAYSNKKIIEDYLDVWVELKSIIVEVDLKTLVNSNIKEFDYKFNALFYNGKLFNIKRGLKEYNNLIGQYKINVLMDGIDNTKKDRMKALDWFWIDTYKYKNNDVDIEYMIDLIDSITLPEDKAIVFKTLKLARCSSLYADFFKAKTRIICDYFTKRYPSKYCSARGDYDGILVHETKNYKFNQKDVDLMYRKGKCVTNSYSLIENSKNTIIHDLEKLIKESIRSKAYFNYELEKAVADINCLFRQKSKNFRFLVDYKDNYIPLVHLKFNGDVVKEYVLPDFILDSYDNNHIRKELKMIFDENEFNLKEELSE